MWFLLFFFAFFFSLKNLKLHDNKTFFNRLLRLFPFYTPWKHQKTYGVPFYTNPPLPPPPKTSENLPFSVFRGYKKGTPGSNGSPDHNLQIRYLQTVHCVKSVRIQRFSGPYFSAFGLSSEGYFVSLRIQSECG